MLPLLISNTNLAEWKDLVGAIESELIVRGAQVARDPDELTDQPHIELVPSASEHRAPNCVGHAIADLRPELTVSDLKDAWAKGDVAFGRSLEIAEAADLIEQRLRGFLLIPAGLGVAVLSGRRELSKSEEIVLEKLAGNHTFRQIAEETNYSLRHVMRIVRGLKARAETTDRASLVAYFGVTDPQTFPLRPRQ